MNKKTLLLFIPLLLCGCDNVIKSIESTSTKPSNSTSTSNSTSQELSKAKQLENLYNTLVNADGQVNSVNSDTTSTVYYLTEGEPLTMPTKDNSTLERFLSNDGQIVIQKGFQSVSQNSAGNFTNFFQYEKQTFYDDNKFYRIADFGDSGSYEEIQFSKDTIDINLNITFSGTERDNIKAMIRAIDVAGFDVEFSGINDYTANGEWTYSYTYLVYESSTSKAKYQEYIYRNTLTMVNGIISKVVQHSEQNIYSGGYKGNWRITDSTFTFNQGNYKEFTGTRFNPSDYVKYKDAK